MCSAKHSFRNFGMPILLVLLVIITGSNNFRVYAQTDQNTTNTQDKNKKDMEVVFWETVKDSNDAEDFEAYLEKYPNGEFASLAKNKLKKIKAGNDKSQSTESPSVDNSSKESSEAVAKFKLARFKKGSDGVLYVYRDRIEYIDSDKQKNNVIVNCSEIVKVGKDIDLLYTAAGDYVFIKTATEKHKFSLRGEIFAGLKTSIEEVVEVIKNTCGLSKKK